VRVLSRSEEGWTLVELMVAASISVVLLGLLGTTLVSGLTTMRIGSQRSTALHDGRVTMNQMQRDLRGSNGFQLCPATASQPLSSCALVVVQPPAQNPQAPPADQTVRYRLAGRSLHRDSDDGTGTFPSSRLVADGVVNLSQSPAVPLFQCVAGGSLLQVRIRLVMRANDPKDAPYEIATIVRPRNTYQPAGC